MGRYLSDQQRVQIAEAALQRFPERRDLLAQLALGELGQDLGVGVVPETSTSSIARPDFPSRSEATQSSLTLLSSSGLVQPLASRWRSATFVLR